MLSPSPSTLSDLLDRALDKGVVINAQIVITLGGIPLVGVNLWAAVAGMQTMLHYGLLNQWDEELRHTLAGSGSPGSPPQAGVGRGTKSPSEL